MTVFERLKSDSEQIIDSSLNEVMPDKAVKKALEGFELPKGRLVLVSIGKAAWQMAKSAIDTVGESIDEGIIITKYGHSKGKLPKMTIFEAGHPVPDPNTFDATQKVIDRVSYLGGDDVVIFLVSGGGSSLFESPTISGDELKDITSRLLSSGADIGEINTIRKRLSKVKGGRFAKLCEPAKVYSIVLSDVIGDRLDVIASGPACADKSTSEEAMAIVSKYDLSLSDEAITSICEETPKYISNVETKIIGSVKELCKAAAVAAEGLGYEAILLTDCLDIEAKDAGRILSERAASLYEKCCSEGKRMALIEGGETVVHITGTGKGGRNQELSLASAKSISGCNIAIFSVGSDGTDGPTDAAGGYVDGQSLEKLKNKGIDIDEVLKDNNSYEALKEIEGLIITGPTGTNVNDFAVALIDGNV